MNDDEKLKLIQEYLKNREKWSDQNIMDEFKSSGKPSFLEESIRKNSPIDESDYSDYSVKRIISPENQKLLDQEQAKRMLTAQSAEEALKQRGYERYKKRGHRGSFGLDSYAFKNSKTGKVLRQLGPIGAILGAAGGLMSDDASAAVGDALIPGGLESTGPAEGSQDELIENPSMSLEARKRALQRLKGN